MTASLGDMRKPYKGEDETFNTEDLVSKEPFGQFKQWFELASRTEGIYEANAMSLATATKDGKPSIRMILLKGYSSKGFIFFTNYNSRKCQEMDENNQVSLMFYWEPLLRSIRIEGRAEKLSKEESYSYFSSRPKSSQIGTCVSNQSSTIQSREVLMTKKSELEKQYALKDVPMPEHWGGYLVKPTLFEFWQGQTDRLHDRIVYRILNPGEKYDSSVTHKGEDGWVYERLAP